MPTVQSLQPALDSAQATLNDAGVFKAVERTDDGLRCDALHVDVTCYYALTFDEAGQAWVGWYTPDRWLSESVEAELVHTGDKIDELLAEEFADQGLDAQPTVQHFRDDDKVFVFRSPMDLPADTAQATDTIAKTMLAYQACFLELGDMAGEED